MGFRIGDLQGATLPLSGSELVELEQAGASRKVQVSDLLPGFEETLGQDLADATDAEKGAALVGFMERSVRDAFLDMVHITYFLPPGGLAADGVTDWQSVFEAAAASSYSSIYVPPGKYLLSVGNIDVTEQKFWAATGKDVGAPYGQNGAVIYTTQTTNPVFLLGNGGCIEGLQFFYPNQDGSTITDVSGYPTIVGAPIIYPPTIKGKTTGISGFEITRNTFINSYHCIEIGDPARVFGSGRGTITHNDAYPIKHFLSLYHCLAEIIVSDFVASPIVYQDVALAGSAKLRRWSQQNAEHFVCSRADGLMVSRGTTLGCKTNIVVKDAVLSLARFENILFDQTLQVLNATDRMSNVTFANSQVYGNTIYAALESSRDLFLFASTVSAAAEGGVTLNNIQVQVALGAAIRLSTSNCVSFLKITDCQFANWGNAVSTAAKVAAVDVDAASVGVRLEVAGNTFRNGNLTYGVGIRQLAGTRLKANDNDFINCQSCVETTNPLTQARIDGNTSENTQGAFSIALAASSVIERGNVWDKPATTKVTNEPWVIALQSSAQTTSAGTPLTMVYQTKNRDGDSSFSAGTGIFTCKTPGSYDMKAVLTHAGGTAGDVFNIELVTTQTTFRKRYTMPATGDSVDIGSPAVDMRVGDTAFIRITRASGSGVFATTSAVTENFFIIRLID